jgi:cellulose synthase/poly-beta-1,6-N-acetylglucosamine synthase-like glycosyltransferase
MALYPLLLLALTRAVRRRFVRKAIKPRISLIISAFNEEAAIAGKIENSLALSYPPDKLEVIVASDGSTDRTDEIVRSFEDRGVKLLRVGEGIGKTAVLNEAAARATGEILAFSDATGVWSKNSLSAMAEHYADPRVGCVTGRVGYTYDGSLTARGFGVYQRYVLALRRAEGSSGGTINASGSIHSIRKSVFKPGPPDTVMDLVDPLHAAMHGYCTTFEESAVSMEESRIRPQDEFRARIRIALRSWRFMAYALPRLPLFRAPVYSFQVVSHKFLRWLIGPTLIPIFLLNLALIGEGWIYVTLFMVQIAYYSLTILGLLLGRFGPRLPGLPALVFFNATNLAYMLSLLFYLRGERVRRWVPAR